MTKRPTLAFLALAVAAICGCQQSAEPKKFGAAPSSNDVVLLQLLTQPSTSATVTKSDSTDVSASCTKGLWVGTAGNVEVQLCNDSNDAGSAPVILNIPSGTFVPGCFKTIYSTGTTASNMVCYGGKG